MSALTPSFPSGPACSGPHGAGSSSARAQELGDPVSLPPRRASCDAFLSPSSSLGSREGRRAGRGPPGSEAGTGVSMSALGLPGTSSGRTDARVAGGPQRRLQRAFRGVGEAAGFSHLARQDGVVGGRERAQKVWTAPGSGADMLKACLGQTGEGRAGLGQACRELCTTWAWPRTECPTHVAALALGRDMPRGQCAQRPAQWEGWGLRACLQPRPRRIQLLGAVSILGNCEPLPRHPGVRLRQAWLWGPGLSWCQAGTVAEAQVARSPPAPGSR